MSLYHVIYIAPVPNTHGVQTHQFKALWKHAAHPVVTSWSLDVWIASVFFSPLFHFSQFFSPLLSPISPSRSTMFPANLLLLMVLLLPQASSGRQGGDTSKTDHGRVSPVPSSLLSPSAGSLVKPSLAETIQSLLLSRLGLQSQPDPRPGVPVPRYLLDLYRFHQQQYHLVEDPSFSFPSQHIQQANTVRSFHHNGKLSDTSYFIGWKIAARGSCTAV